MTSDSRFALYLIPPYPIARDVAEIHAMLRKQFGFKAADLFQVHCTIKGFFKKTDIPIPKMIVQLDHFILHQKPFQVYFSGYRINQIGITLDMSRDGSSLEEGGNSMEAGLNTELLNFRDGVVDTLRPFIAPDCDFVAADLGNPFRAHITLAFRDIPDSLFDEVLAWLEASPLPTGSFCAQNFHFLEFFCQDWSGPWWQTLTWKYHKSWLLK